MSQVSTQLEGSTAVLSLEGRTDLNLLGLELFQSLIDGLDEIAADANVTTVVLRGAGERAFSAGVDLHEMGRYDRLRHVPDNAVHTDPIS